MPTDSSMTLCSFNRFSNGQCHKTQQQSQERLHSDLRKFDSVLMSDRLTFVLDRFAAVVPALH
jgi:hypothetical protein